MKCIIPGSNVKVFGRAIHCLSKIGEDLYMEPLDTGLALRAVNSSRSAYACFLFSPSFFLRYDDGSLDNDATQNTQGDDETTRWRVTMKSCLAVFKSLANLEKNVDRCNIHLDMKDCRLVFQLHCKHGIVKTYNLVYQETETLQAVFSKDTCPNRITAPSKLLAEAVASFQVSQEEVTLTVNPSQLGFKNYVDDEPDPSRVVHSELHLVPEEFNDYSIGVDTEVTFCLKELRAILSFSDAAGLPVSFQFETTGKPIIFSIESDQTVEATFVLATLADVTNSQMTSSQQSRQSQACQSTPTTSHQRQRTSEIPRQRSMSSSMTTPAQKRSHMSGRGDASGRLQAGRRLPNGHSDRNNKRNEDDDEFPDDLMLDILSRHNDSTSDTTTRDYAAETSSRPSHRRATSLSNDDITGSPVIPIDSALSSRFQKSLVNQSHQGPSDRLHPPPPQQQEHTSPNRTLLANFEDENSAGSCEEVCLRQSSLLQDVDGDNGGGDVDGDDDGYDFVPGTPPSKKFKSMFFGASQSQQSQSSTQRSRPPTSQPHPKGASVTVLAADSDED